MQLGVLIKVNDSAFHVHNCPLWVYYIVYNQKYHVMEMFKFQLHLCCLFCPKHAMRTTGLHIQTPNPTAGVQAYYPKG